MDIKFPFTHLIYFAFPNPPKKEKKHAYLFEDTYYALVFLYTQAAQQPKKQYNFDNGYGASGKNKAPSGVPKRPPPTRGQTRYGGTTSDGPFISKYDQVIVVCLYTACRMRWC